MTVIEQMLQEAELFPDFSARFYGSPRKFMEVPDKSVSNGKGYTDLYDQGLIRTGRAKKSVWYIPPEIVKQHLAS